MKNTILKSNKLFIVLICFVFFLSAIIPINLVVAKSPQEENNFITIIDDADIGEGMHQISYSNGWVGGSGNADSYKGTYHWAQLTTEDESTKSFSVNFEGKKIEIHGAKRNWFGIYEIQIDDKKPVKINARSETDAWSEVIFDSGELDKGKHTLTFTFSKENQVLDISGVEANFDYLKVYHDDIPLEDIKLNSENVLLEAGREAQITIELIPSYTTVKDLKFIYSVEDENIAKVSEDGKITALNEGKTVLRVKVKGYDIEKTIDIEVLKNRGNLRATIVDTDHHYYQTDHEELSQKTDFSWSGTAWRNDEMLSEISLITLDKKASEVEIIASNFINEDGDILNSDIVTISLMKETSAHIGHGAQAGGAASQPRVSVPDIIYGGNKTDIEANQVQNIWLNFDIPQDAKSGTYKGTITVKSKEQGDIVLDYSFEVLDIVAPNPENYEKTLELWEYPFDVAKYYGIEDKDLFGEKHLNILKENLQLYKEAGGSVATGIILDREWEIGNPISVADALILWYKEKDGSITYDYSRFDKWFELNEELGIADKIKLFSVSSERTRLINRETGEYEWIDIYPGTDEWYKFFGDFLHDFIPHLEEKGWVDKTYFAVDEIGEDLIKLFIDLLNKNVVNGKKLKLSAAVNYSHMSEETMMQIDDVSISLDYIGRDEATKHIVEKRNELGLDTAFYTCVGTFPNSFALNNPADSAWTIWYNNALGFDGYLRWAYNSWTPKPYENLDYVKYEAGDTMLIYPDDNPNAENPITRTTPRFENMKQAKRDVEKLNYLMKQRDDLKEKGQALLDSLGRIEGKYNSYGGKYAANEEDAEYIVNETNRMREGLVELSKSYIKTRTVDKTALKIALDLANAITDKDLENVVPVVVNEFKVARDQANEVYNDSSSSQDEVDAAFDRLSSIMQKLEFFKGDKTALKAFIDKVSDLEAAKYTEATWKPFNDALKAATSVYEDENAMQEEVNNAYKELVIAFLNLRLIPEKSLLEELINQAEGLNSANYTKASYKVVSDTLNEAKVVFNNPNATQKEVDSAKATLEKAIAGLQANSSTSSNVDNTVKTPVSNGDTTTSVKTGDNGLAGMFAGLALLGVAGYAALRRKD